MITLANYYEIFNALLNPEQLEGLHLLLTQFPQHQFDSAEDRRTDRAHGMIGVTCVDCHTATPSALRGQALFVGKARCSACPPPRTSAATAVRGRSRPRRIFSQDRVDRSERN